MPPTYDQFLIHGTLECFTLYGKRDFADTIKQGGTSLEVQWLRLCAPNPGGLGSIHGQETRSHMQ